MVASGRASPHYPAQTWQAVGALALDQSAGRRPLNGGAVTIGEKCDGCPTGSGPKSKFVYIRRAAYSKSATKMTDELFINKPVPGADQYYPLNDPPIGTALPEVCAGIFEISARGIE